MKILKNLSPWKFLFALRPVLIPSLVFAVELILFGSLIKNNIHSQVQWSLLSLTGCILLVLLLTAFSFFNPKKHETLLAAVGSITPLLASILVAVVAYAVRAELPFPKADWLMITLVLSFTGQTMVTVWHLSMSHPASASFASDGADIDVMSVAINASTDNSD